MAFSLKKFSELSAVSGNEGEARKYIISNTENLCDDIYVDSMGNIIAFKKGKSDKYKLMLGTNIDEAGFIVSDITDKGYIKIKSVGSIDPRTLISKRVAIGNSHVKGVIGMKAIHLQKKAERETAVELSSLYIDIGAKDKKSAEKNVTLGDYVTFDTEFCEIGGRIKGKALDRFGAVCLVDSMTEVPAYDTYFVFSTQREIPAKISGRGMMTAAFRVQPDFALIIDTVDTADVYKSKTPQTKLGGGAVIEYMDKTSILNTVFTSAIKERADMYSIPVQDKTSSVNSTIAGAVQASSTGAVTACVGIPCRYSHTPVCFMDKNDLDSVTAVCRAVLKESDVIIDGIIKKAD